MAGRVLGDNEGSQLVADVDPRRQLTRASLLLKALRRVVRGDLVVEEPKVHQIL